MTRRLGPQEVEAAAALLRAGALVAFPTETVYGLGADAAQPAAVAAVFASKGRPAHDPLIVHVAPALLGPDPLRGLQHLGLVAALTPAAEATTRALIAQAWPGPLTLVLPAGAAVLPEVCAGGPSVAVRMPDHPLAVALLTAAGRPLVAPSANRFGRVSPTSAEHVLDELDGRIHAVLDGGPCAIGVESTVVRVRPDGGLDVLRPGAFDPAAAALGDEAGLLGSPGRLPSHYAPRTPLVLVPAGTRPEAHAAELAARAPRALGWIAWSAPPPGAPALAPRVHVDMLAPDGQLSTAARRLYACLRAADGEGLDLLVVERTEEAGMLADAVRDRLARAAHGTVPLQNRK